MLQPKVGEPCMMIKSIIPRCIQTIIIQDHAQGILIIPVWPTQPWFCQAHTTPTTQQVTTNGLSTLWESFKRYIVSPEITKILMASWQDSTKKQYKAHVEKWLAFCHQRCISYSSPKVNEALDLLMVLYNKGLTYSIINTAGLLFHPSLLSKVGTTLDSTP